MDRFYSTCAAGLEYIAIEMAKASLRGVRDVSPLGGAFLYSTNEDIPYSPIFQNTYRVIAEYRGVFSIEKLASLVSRDKDALNKADLEMKKYGFRTFRCMFSDRNRLASVNPGTRTVIERAVKSAKADRVSPETELLLLTRTEGTALFLLRLTKRGNTEKALAKGELSPSIASAMVFLSGARPGGIFCDPFAGHGAIGQARAIYCQAKEIHLSDIDPDMIAVMKSKPILRRKNIFISKHDIFEPVPETLSGRVTEVAADPPWGIFAPLPKPAEGFYRDMLMSLSGYCTPGAGICILSADKDNFEKACGVYRDIRFDSRTDILVNGKKGALYKGTRL